MRNMRRRPLQLLLTSLCLSFTNRGSLLSEVRSLAEREAAKKVGPAHGSFSSTLNLRQADGLIGARNGEIAVEQLPRLTLPLHQHRS